MERKRQRSTRERRQPEGASSDAAREAGERIEQRRDRDREMDRREDDGWSQPESSAQKTPPGGPTQ